MSAIDWKKGKPFEDGEYLVTVSYAGASAQTRITSFKGGEWSTTGNVEAWDYKPEPFNQKRHELEAKIEMLEMQLKDMEAAWSEIHGEMKYYEGAAEALTNVFNISLNH